MRRFLPIPVGVAAALAMTTSALAQLQMQEQSVGAPRRSPPVYKPQSLDEPTAGTGAARPPPVQPTKPKRTKPAPQSRD